jgi:glc operon protein GlcG
MQIAIPKPPRFTFCLLEDFVMYLLAIVLLSLSLVPPAVCVDEPESLVTRNHVKLQLAGAQKVIQGALARAKEMKLTVNVAVVDEGGHLLAFARMDGARPASVYTALTKATAAATYRQSTGPSSSAAGQPDLLLSLSLQNAAAVSGGKMTSLKGGVPILIAGQVVGAVGVGGGTGEQDAEVGKAGITLLEESLSKEKK